jgi:hypothetical protein
VLKITLKIIPQIDQWDKEFQSSTGASEKDVLPHLQSFQLNFGTGPVGAAPMTVRKKNKNYLIGAEYYEFEYVYNCGVR